MPLMQVSDYGEGKRREEKESLPVERDTQTPAGRDPSRSFSNLV
jgi:hypothetical protein